MLKLEKHAHSVEVILRHRDNLLTPRFLFALCLALFIHLTGLLLFHVKPYFVKDAARIYPPVEISIDFRSEEGMVEAQISGERKPLFSFELPRSIPTFPLVPFSAAKKYLYHQNTPLNRDPFAKLADECVDDEFALLDKSSANSRPLHPIDIRFTGNLSHLKVINEGWLEGDFPGVGLGKKAKNYQMLFAIKIDHRTGRIFWREPRNPLKKTVLITYADQILNQIAFEKDKNGFIIEGELEISFYYYD